MFLIDHIQISGGILYCSIDTEFRELLIANQANRFQLMKPSLVRNKLE